MSLPPEQVTLRRKRGAEAVDTLYIQNESQRVKRVREGVREGEEWYYIRSIHGPVNENQRLQPTQSSQPQAPLSQVPAVRTTHADEDENVRGPQSLLGVSGQEPFGTHGLPQTLQGNGEAVKKAKVPPRAFRLAKPASNYSLGSSVISGGIRKHRKKRPGEFPLFIEKTARMMEARVKRPNDAPCVNSNDEPQRGIDTPEEERPMTRKRPIVTAADKEWRSRNWANVQASRNSKEEDRRPTVTKTIPLTYDPIDLAAQLSEFAMMEAQQPHSLPTPLAPDSSKAVVAPPKAKLKFQPKSPPDRSRKHQADTTMTGVGGHGEAAIEDAEDQDYVYDTFIRRPIVSMPGDGLAAPGTEVQQGMDTETSGVLVIESGDEELWEAYMEDEDDGAREFLSDEDDENAEDYYGNDYPEDEVESDDEHGRAAYSKYRKDGSDDEDYDAEVAAAWSEEEDKFGKWT